MKFSLHRHLTLLAIFLQLPIPKTQLSSIPLLPSSYPSRLASRNSTQLFSSQSHIATDGRSVSQSVSQSVLVSSPHLGLMTGYLLLFDSYSLVIVGRSLWREDGSVFCHSQLFSTELFLITTLHWSRRQHNLTIAGESRFLAMDVSSDFTIPALGRHVAVLTDWSL
jgi:hypothetical protein